MYTAELKGLTQNFLKTFGYIAKPTNEPNCVLFSRPTGLGISDELLIYFHELAQESKIEFALRQLSKSYARVPGGERGRKIFLSPSPIGKVPPAIKENDFVYQVPVWFFDREFSSDKKSTPLKKLEEEAAKYEEERIEQPYTSDTNIAPDLLCDLLRELEQPTEPLVRIIVAPAGYGKTVLMGSLYTKLKGRFIENKQKQYPCMRPLLMLPGHLKRASDLDDLINNFIGAEYDYGVTSAETFSFWVKNNFVIWLIDGLEELILKIPEEFIYTLLDEYVFSSDSVASQIILTIRKPVLATSSELRYAMDEWKGTGLRVYELCGWKREQQNRYFLKNLHLSQSEIKNFISDITKSYTLQNICTVPYYCSVVADLRNRDAFRAFNDDSALIEYALQKICTREFDKGLDADIISLAIQKDFFSDLAEESFKGNRITQELIEDYISIYLEGLDPTVKANQAACLLRHALLTRTGDDIDFVHDIMKQYLVGRFLLKYLKSGNLEIFDKQIVETDSLAEKILINNAYQVDWNSIMKSEIYKLRVSANEDSIGFRNIMKIFLTADIAGKESLVKDLLQDKNLTGLRFKYLNLSTFNFEHSNLTDTEFINCDLTKARFNGCFFKNTFFDPRCKMEGATTKGAITEIIRAGTRVLDDQKEINRYFCEVTRTRMEQESNCQAVINLRKVLEKLIRKGRGYNVPKTFLLRTKCGGRVPANKCVEACIENRIVHETGSSIRIRIDLFNEVERFVQNLEHTTGINKILDEICPDTTLGCQHICR